MVATALHELNDDQRYILKTLVEQHFSKRLAAIFSLGYWAGVSMRLQHYARTHATLISRRAVSLLPMGKAKKTGPWTYITNGASVLE
jgi:hypothetical protein